MKYENDGKIILFKIIYLPEENNQERVKIFDKIFINNNKYKCKIIYNNRKFELKEYFEDIDNNYNHKDLIKFKLIFIQNLINMSFMFYDCNSLISLSKLETLRSKNESNKIIYPKIKDKLNVYNIINNSNQIKKNNNFKRKNYLNLSNMNSMFYNCKSLTLLPDISKWDTTLVTDMSFMFSGCASLISLPHISEWNTSNVIDMSLMFTGCYSLLSLPDLSKWNTSNVESMSHMFFGCFSLESLPDIYKWDLSNVKYMRKMFKGCKLLLKSPNFFFWNIQDLLDMKDEENIYFEISYKSKEYNKEKIRIFGRIFVKNNKDKCKIIYNKKIFELKEYFHDIDNNYNNNDPIKLILCLDINITDMSFMFSGCDSLISFEELSNFFIFNEESNRINAQYNSISSMSEDSSFNNTNFGNQNNSSLSLSNISKKDISSFIDINKEIGSFFKFSSLKIKEITNLSYMFSGCNSLISLPDISKWDISNVFDINNMFSGCNSLITIPDISKWEISNVKDIGALFYGCTSLISIPDISK